VRWLPEPEMISPNSFYVVPSNFCNCIFWDRFGSFAASANKPLLENNERSLFSWPWQTIYGVRLA
jgi:hypothetical protein